MVLRGCKGCARGILISAVQPASLMHLSIVLDATLTPAAYCQPVGFTNLDHLAVYKKTRMAIGAAASTLCFTSNIYFYSINRGHTSYLLKR